MNPNSDRQKSLDQNGTDVRREYTVQGETTHSEPRHRPPQPQNRTPTAIPDVDVTHDQDLRTSKTVSPEDLEKLSNLLGAGKDTEAEEENRGRCNESRTNNRGRLPGRSALARSTRGR